MNLDTIWDESFLEAIGETEQKSGVNPVDWRTSGKSKARAEGEDKVWWDVNGKKMFNDFVQAWKDSGFTIWQPSDGVAGIEIELNHSFGDIPIRAFADAIVEDKGSVAVVDFKTGKYMPDSALQLGIYASLMELHFGFRPSKGYYYSARKAEFIEIPGLARWTIPVLTELFTQFNRAIENEIFLPNVGMSCSTCGVKEYCYAVGGQLSDMFDPLTTIK